MGLARYLCINSEFGTVPVAAFETSTISVFVSPGLMLYKMKNVVGELSLKRAIAQILMIYLRDCKALSALV